MTTRGTTWSLDTCNCVILLEYDDVTALDARDYTLKDIPTVCNAHTALATKLLQYDAAKTENNRKNQAIQLIIDNSPASMENVIFVYQADGITRVIKKGVSFQFAISGTAPNRIVTISYTGFTLTNTQKNTAQTWFDNRFGVGKVIIA